MDASVYFQLCDRIDAARAIEEVDAIRDAIELADPHPIERRALERRLTQRERVMLLARADDEVSLLARTGLADVASAPERYPALRPPAEQALSRQAPPREL